jgi:hypothetical protein
MSEQGKETIYKSGMEALNKSDLYLKHESKGPSYEGKVDVPAGNSVFRIRNDSDKNAEVTLECNKE